MARDGRCVRALARAFTRPPIQTAFAFSPKDQRRIQARGLGTNDWLPGKAVTVQGCTMVKLDGPSPPLLKKEPGHALLKALTNANGGRS